MVRLGVESFVRDYGDSLDTERLGLISNPSGVTRDLTPTVDLLYRSDNWNLRRLFAPEHGIRGNVRENGSGVDETIDDRTGLPVRSVRGENGTQFARAIEDLDVVIYDMQDVGCRFYTLVSTLVYALKGVEEADKRLLVLDRPNPIAPLEPAGNLHAPLGGSTLEEYVLPVVHGLTVGELAWYFKEEFDIRANVEVVEVEEWERETWYDETGHPWVPPSPNMPTLETATLYPGTCFFEGTTLSEGRGTAKPFELVGAPWVDAQEWADQLNDFDLPGVGFRPAYFTPMFSKHERRDIEGVQLHILDRDRIDPVHVGFVMLISAFTTYPESDWLQYDSEHFIDRLVGGSHLRKMVDEANAEADPMEMATRLREYWHKDIDRFTDLRQRYALY
ncbi:exo-beta-N-acetylmuramidase NamZ domain-containing protein [Haladaptatus pallidirubidus]|uniref:DUF1343 domain-containing protein n=1 Tax=Haladaptatus pallidirubidus TaxID=1008152 RepID=A0AAV3UJE2_9EURY|nr:DUF1343 domain-containing protein [Haladaptatus pallidirubidus]